MKAIFNTQYGYVASLKPYAKSWGFLQAKMRNEVSLYDAIYKSILNATDFEQSEDADLGWLVIPMNGFNIPANGTDKNITAFNAVYRVCSDNQDLLAFASPIDYFVVNDGGFVSSYKLRVPADITEWKEKRREIWKTVSEIDEYVQKEAGFSIANKPTTEVGKKEVASVLHDWILENVSNNDAYENSNYWTHNAYNCLRSLSSQTDKRSTDCSGFSSAYQLLCRQYDINCIQVLGGVGDSSSGATGTKTNHSWNILSIDLPIGKYDSDVSKWYAVDLRFDEYVKDGKVETNGIIATDTRRYFMTKNIYSDTTNTTVKGHDYRKRANNDIGYPVEVTAAYY